ncbi:E3 ubiquitin-protein ligase XB3 [Iris pallida]|uniref:E3 ubiquitin-protein ligase XB3 n=1 Tax=Iris pallida TaxID=29817 RepID=A0AAX6DKG8_IRIPA|nr:E3 ubiquitin-protein ligase XB3 [Iris pallida]
MLLFQGRGAPAILRLRPRAIGSSRPMGQGLSCVGPSREVGSSMRPSPTTPTRWGPRSGGTPLSSTGPPSTITSPPSTSPPPTAASRSSLCFWIELFIPICSIVIGRLP